MSGEMYSAIRLTEATHLENISVSDEKNHPVITSPDRRDLLIAKNTDAIVRYVRVLIADAEAITTYTNITAVWDKHEDAVIDLVNPQGIRTEARIVGLQSPQQTTMPGYTIFQVFFEFDQELFARENK